MREEKNVISGGSANTTAKQETETEKEEFFIHLAISKLSLELCIKLMTPSRR